MFCFRSYVERPIAYNRQFDVIINDGRARVAVANRVLKNNLLVDGGVMVMHDWERKEYQVVLGIGRFKIWKQEDSGIRQTAFLVSHQAS